VELADPGVLQRLGTNSGGGMAEQRCGMGKGRRRKTNGRAELKKTWYKINLMRNDWLKLHSIQEHTHYSRNIKGKNNTSRVF
jgi:hypothetical protein